MIGPTKFQKELFYWSAAVLLVGVVIGSYFVCVRWPWVFFGVLLFTMVAAAKAIIESTDIA